MAITKVQGPLNAVGGSGVHTVSKAYTSNVTAGNFLVAYGNCSADATTSGAVTDSLGQTWTAATTWADQGHVAGAIFYKANTLGGACTVTLTCGTIDGFPDLTIYEFSGAATTSPLDVQTSNFGNSTAPASGSVTTTNAADVLIGGSVSSSGAGVTAGTSGWTFAVTGNANGEEYQIVSATGTYNATFTAGTGAWYASIAAFKAAGAVTLHFPLAIADTSTVVALGLEVQRHFPLAIADTSTVVALGFHLQGHFSLAIADTSSVLALGFHFQQHFSLAIADTSTVVALRFFMPVFSIGPTSPGPSSGTLQGIGSSQVTLPQNGTLSSISVYFTGNPGQAFLLGIYSDASGQPGTLLASSAIGSSTVGLNTLPISGAPILARGTYWLATQYQGTIAGNYNPSGGASYYNTGQSWTGAMPNPFPAGTSATFVFSIYATFATVANPSFPVAIADTSAVSISFHGAAAPPGNILKVQGPITGNSGGPVIAQPYGAGVTAGNFLVAVVSCGDLFTQTPSVTDSLGQSWIQSTYANDSGPTIASGIFYVPNTLGGACTVTYSGGGSASFAEITLYEFSGVATSSLTDGATFATATSATPASGSITTANANDLLIASAVTAGATAITAGTSGWTTALTANGNAAQYDIVSAAGPYNATFTSSNAAWVANIAAFKGAGITGPLHFSIAIADTSNVVALGFHGGTVPSPGGGYYSTAFPLTENPISENSHWINGGTTGLDWTDVRTTPALAFGTIPGNSTGPAVYDDSTAVLTGTWAPNQTAQATIRVISAVGTGSGIFEEVALRLRTTISPHSITGYECLISISTDPANNYVQIVRWNGPLGNFTELNGSGHHAVNGDILKATIVGSTITVYLNGTSVVSATDSTYTSGSPGVGFFLQNATGLNANYGFSAFSASDGTFGVHIADTSTVVALGFHGAGAAPRFPVRIADTSTVVALGFRVPQRFPVTIADSSTVVALGLEVARRFPVTIADTSTVVALGFEFASFVTNNFVTSISTATVRDDVTGFVGFKFQVAANPLVVRALGRWVMPGRSGPGAVHQLQLLQDPSTLLGTVSVDTTGKPTGNFTYATLPSPITLAAGGTYQLLSQESFGSGDPWFSNDCVPVTTSDATVRGSILVTAFLHFGLAIADSSTVTALGFHALGNSYTTAFGATENPISENNNWINGGVVGLDFTNVRTSTALAFGTMPGNASAPAQYADSTAVLAGTWGPNQTAQATIRIISASGASGVFEEVELRLRTTISPHSITGYEINCSVHLSDFYVQIVRWNGPLGNFTLLDARTTAQAHNGDILKATIVGSTITAFLNGTPLFSVTDSTYTGGSPGIGFYLQGATGLNANYGFSAFSATDH